MSDTKRLTRITVTQEDIDSGTPYACGHCPVSKALTRAFGETVHTDGTWAWREGYPEVTLPPEVGMFVSKFDTQQPVEPFTFEADLEALR